MLGWLRWLRRYRQKPEGPLLGVPEAVRVKTYSAGSGYVYQYFYEGRRPTPNGVEYVFSVSAAGDAYFPARVVIPDAAIESWEEATGRELLDRERYAVAKMALREAFDERPGPAELRAEVRVPAKNLAVIAKALGLG